MSVIIYFYIIVIPLIPFLVGTSMSIAPLGGPLAIVSLQLFLGVTLKTIFLNQDADLFTTKVWLQRSNDSFENAIFFVSAFSIFICLGYWLSSKHERHLPKYKGKRVIKDLFVLNKKQSFLSLLIAVIICLTTCFLYLQQKGLIGLSLLDIIINANVSKLDIIEGGTANFGKSYSFITQFFTITKIYLLIFYSNIIRNRKCFINKVGFITLLILSLFQILISGRRNSIISLVFPLIIITSIFKRKLQSKQIFTNSNSKGKLKNIIYISILVPIFILIFNFITYVRGGFDGNLSLSFLLSSENLINPILKSTYFTDINIVASIIERMSNNDIDFLFGESYLYIIYGFIPRFIWTNKPAIALGIFVKNEIFGLTGTIGGIPPTLPGEAFINFGWFGLFVAVIYGFFLRRFEFITFNRNFIIADIGIYIYTLLVTSFSWSLMQSSFASIFNGIVSALIVLWITTAITKCLKKMYV